MIGTILLSRDNKYIDKDGKLPERPPHDKDMLRAMSIKQIVSTDGYEMLPPSIRKVCTSSASYTMPVTIRELAKADILLVSRSEVQLEGGKEFRLTDFKCIIKERSIECWVNTKNV